MKVSKTIEKPIITEKATELASKGKYTFCVVKKASKYAIKQDLQRIFGVDVTSVKTMIMPGKPKRVGKTNRFTKTSSWKKAVVSIKEGQKIDLFEKVA